MARTVVAHQMRWIVGVAVALLSLSACSTQVPAASTVNTPGANRLFDGEWAYSKKCDFGHYVSISLKQAGGEVFGEWGEGTNLRGSDGLLKGTIRDGKLFVRYCSQDEEKGYKACPEYGDEVDYFVIQRNDLIRYRRYGGEYKEEIALHRDIAGKQLPADTSNCQKSGDDEDAP